MTTMTGAQDGMPAYPVRLDVVRAEAQSRLTNFPLGIGMFIRYILLIPHLIILYFLALVAYLLYFIATFAILFTGRFPQGLHGFVAGFMRWNTNVTAYVYSLLDKYPPFSMDQQDYPLTFEVDYPDTSSRLLNFPFFGIIIKSFLLIPHYIVVAFLGIAALVVIFIAQFAILFSGAFPAGMHKFVVGYTRWSMRLTAYTLALTDKYPPFSLS